MKKLIWKYDTISVQSFCEQTKITEKDVMDLVNSFNLKLPLKKDDAVFIADYFNILLIDSRDKETFWQDYMHSVPNQKRRAVITVMGHIDAGKTTLVDYILKTNVANKEIGGITQKIHTYEVTRDSLKSDSSFLLLDTPGHSLFSSLRDFILKITDLVVLVISADSGLQEQTVEIINLLKNYKHLQCLIAITKIDRGYNNTIYTKIISNLAELGLVCEEYGGEVSLLPVSAKTGEGMQNLIESIILHTDLMDLKFDNKRPAIATIIDSTKNTKVGFEAQVITHHGFLKTGDIFFTKESKGKIRSIYPINDNIPSSSYKITGFDNKPQLGSLLVFKDPELIKIYEDLLKQPQKIHRSTENKNEKVSYLLKVSNVSQEEALMELIHSRKGHVISISTGKLTDNEIELAKHNNAIVVIWGQWNKEIENLTIISDEIIYQIQQKLDLILKPPKKPIYKIQATAEIIKLFDFKDKLVLGCKITNGVVKLGQYIKIASDHIETIVEINESSLSFISSIKFEKNNLEEAKTGMAVGLQIKSKNHYEWKIGDKIHTLEQTN